VASYILSADSSDVDKMHHQEPLDQLSPNEYLTTESNIAAFATDQYQVLPTHPKENVRDSG